MVLVDGCYACEHDSVADDIPVWERIHVGPGWRIAHTFDSALPGWLVLLPRRHVLGAHELTAEEAVEFGVFVRRASIALVEVTGCLKTYVALFAEAEDFAHLHVHAVPRYADTPVDGRRHRVTRPWCRRAARGRRRRGRRGAPSR